MTKTTFALLAVLFTAACGPRHADCGKMTGPASEAFRAEAEAAEEILPACVDVEVLDQPWSCPGSETGLCAGEALTLSVKVLYNPALGFGPGIGTTALEHELCHTHYARSEAEANACAASLTAAVKAKLGR